MIRLGTMKNTISRFVFVWVCAMSHTCSTIRRRFKFGRGKRRRRNNEPNTRGGQCIFIHSYSIAEAIRVDETKRYDTNAREERKKWKWSGEKKVTGWIWLIFNEWCKLKQIDILETKRNQPIYYWRERMTLARLASRLTYRCRRRRRLLFVWCLFTPRSIVGEFRSPIFSPMFSLSHSILYHSLALFLHSFGPTWRLIANSENERFFFFFNFYDTFVIVVSTVHRVLQWQYRTSVQIVMQTSNGVYTIFQIVSVRSTLRHITLWFVSSARRVHLTQIELSVELCRVEYTISIHDDHHDLRSTTHQCVQWSRITNSYFMRFCYWSAARGTRAHIFHFGSKLHIATTKQISVCAWCKTLLPISQWHEWMAWMAKFWTIFYDWDIFILQIIIDYYWIRERKTNSHIRLQWHRREIDTVYPIEPILFHLHTHVCVTLNDGEFFRRINRVIIGISIVTQDVV